MADYPEIIVGTYEEFLLGYRMQKGHDGKYQLNLNMASHAHQGSIRCIAAYHDLLASSGADEYVNIFSLINRKEVAVLTPHAGTVTSLAFAPDGSHLISGSQDGSIAIFRCSDWTMMKIWNDAHKKANGVIGISIHPSGKLLLSIGADNILRAWNLVKGRQAYAINLNKRITPGNTLNMVSWSNDGSHYAITIGAEAEVYNVGTAALVYKVKSSSRISCFDLSLEDIISLGRDDGILEIHNFKEKKKLLEQAVHEKRIKCLQLFKQGDEENFLVSADSQGVIRFWRWKRNRKTQKLANEAEVNADCRIVCLALVNPNHIKIENEDGEGNDVVIRTKSTEDNRNLPLKADEIKLDSLGEVIHECIDLEDNVNLCSKSGNSENKFKKILKRKRPKLIKKDEFQVTPSKDKKLKKNNISSSTWVVSNVT